MADSPFALNTDGTAKDPVAFQQGIRNDPDKLAVLQTEPDTLQTVLGDDTQALQDLLRSTHKVGYMSTVCLWKGGTHRPY